MGSARKKREPKLRRTIDTLESTARRTVDIPAVWAVELDGIKPGLVGPSAGDDGRRVAVHSRARAERLVHL